METAEPRQDDLSAGRLVAEVAHDLLNPVSSALGLIRLLNDPDRSLPADKRARFGQLAERGLVAAADLLVDLAATSLLADHSRSMHARAVRAGAIALAVERRVADLGGPHLEGPRSAAALPHDGALVWGDVDLLADIICLAMARRLSEGEALRLEIEAGPERCVFLIGPANHKLVFGRGPAGVLLHEAVRAMGCRLDPVPPRSAALSVPLAPDAQG